MGPREQSSSTPNGKPMVYMQGETLTITDDRQTIPIRTVDEPCYCKGCQEGAMDGTWMLLDKQHKWRYHETTRWVDNKVNTTLEGAHIPHEEWAAGLAGQWMVNTVQVILNIAVHNLPAEQGKLRKRRIRPLQQEDMGAIKKGECREPHDNKGDREWAVGITVTSLDHVEPVVIHCPIYEDRETKPKMTTVYTRDGDRKGAVRRAMG